MPSGLPETVGRYEIRRELGRGMMGVVYEAHDPALGRDIALKVIHVAIAVGAEDRKSFEQRFFAEARTAARLSHPGIVVVHDVGRDGSGELFMALELLQGRTLDVVLKERGVMPWREALQIAQRLADALHHAHSNGIVHRDIKPANVMLLPSGEPKIMDFGIAKLETSQLTAAGQFLGTPLYMSPEQALAQAVDGRSDLFSLGSVLYELVTGRAAFAGESVTKVLFQIMSREPAAATSLASGLPKAVDSVLQRCLAKDVSRRYPDGRALSEDLGDVLAGRPPRGLTSWEPAPVGASTVAGSAPPAAASPTSPPATLQSQAPARRGPALGAALAATALVLGALWYYRNASDQPVARRVGAAADASLAENAERPATAADPAPGAPVSDKAQLLIDFEHSLKGGTLRIWVDDEPVIEERVGSRVTQDIAGLKLRKGRLSDALEIVPGRREVKVQVAWDDGFKTATTFANFKAGVTRRLKVRLGSLGGLRKDLSLDWQ